MSNLQRKLNELKTKLYSISPELRPKTRLHMHNESGIEIDLYGRKARDIVREFEEGFPIEIANIEVVKTSHYTVKITPTQGYKDHHQQKSLEHALSYLYKKAEDYQFKKR